MSEIQIKLVVDGSNLSVLDDVNQALAKLQSTGGGSGGLNLADMAHSGASLTEGFSSPTDSAPVEAGAPPQNRASGAADPYSALTQHVNDYKSAVATIPDVTKTSASAVQEATSAMVAGWQAVAQEILYVIALSASAANGVDTATRNIGARGPR